MVGFDSDDGVDDDDGHNDDDVCKDDYDNCENNQLEEKAEVGKEGGR